MLWETILIIILPGSYQSTTTPLIRRKDLTLIRALTTNFPSLVGFQFKPLSPLRKEQASNCTSSITRFPFTSSSAFPSLVCVLCPYLIRYVSGISPCFKNSGGYIVCLLAAELQCDLRNFDVIVEVGLEQPSVAATVAGLVVFR
jgi:hypothetical protein